MHVMLQVPPHAVFLTKKNCRDVLNQDVLVEFLEPQNFPHAKMFHGCPGNAEMTSER